MLRTTLLCIALLATTGCPDAWGRGLVDLDLVDRDTGQVLPEYARRGDVWVAGVPGHRYSVRLTNTSSERVLVVLSVDGVNAVTGEDAHAAQNGYVLAPWQSTEITGWRKSMDDVAQFVFTDLPDSYAARTGRPHNVGVVGIAVFREARPVYVPPPMPAAPVAAPREEAAQSDALAKSGAPAAAAESSARDAVQAQQRQRLGTGHGAREWSPVSRTDFVRASRSPSQVMQIRYDDVDALVSMGVMPRPYDPYAHGHWGQAPRAFPGFVADPPR